MDQETCFGCKSKMPKWGVLISTGMIRGYVYGFYRYIAGDIAFPGLENPNYHGSYAFHNNECFQSLLETLANLTEKQYGFFICKEGKWTRK